MIRVIRTEKPKVLQKLEDKWTAKIHEAVHAILRVEFALSTNNSDNIKKILLKSLEKHKVNLDKAKSKYKHPEIKDSLEKKMFHGKCAYCESFILNVDYGAIEHFKPKSKFPEEAVKWDNLLLSCNKCNGAEYKGDKWFDEEENGPLLNPCNDNDDPQIFFEFIFDENTQIAIVRPNNDRARLSEETYGLNKYELVQHRNKYVRYLVVLASYYHSDNRAKLLLDEATKDSGEYAAFARMVKQKYTSGNP